MNWVKKDLFGCFKKRRTLTNNNKTGLKEEGGIKNLNYSAPFTITIITTIIVTQ